MFNMLEHNKKLSCWIIKKDSDYTTHPTVPKIMIPKVKVPSALHFALKQEPYSIKEVEKCRNYIKCIKSLSNVKNIRQDEYFFVLKICLYLEQYQSDLDLKSLRKDYNIVQVTSDRFIINVPSLDSEKPIIVAEDTITLHDVIAKKKYPGTVIRVEENNVTIRLEVPNAIEMKKNKKYNIKFYGHYWPLRCCHYALSLASKFNFIEIIYPQQTTNNIDLKCNIDWINTNIVKNKQQKQAVIRILHMTASPAPYIIFGPPGTGKTATLVEAICQIVKQNSRNNILVCTSSNAAADEITQRLIKYLPTEIIYRMYAPSRHWEDVKTDIQKCANFVTGVRNTTIFLPKEVLVMKKIIISTLITSIRLAAVRLRENHFSHIIIDEASQITEPEMLIPITLTKHYDVKDITNFQSQIVIAGDHHQLGPVVRSKFAINILGKSMLERLMTDCDLYKKKNGKYNPNYVTKLVKNYRSHKDILHVPNKHFYDGDLVCCEQPDTQIALNWEKLPAKNFPIIFQEVRSVEERTETKSVYNQVEALVVVQYVKMLMNAKFGKHRISAKDIGIVTPFKKQQLDIIHRLAIRGWEDIFVGTVEMFQGQERTVIIISTARSKIFTHNGVEHIGFLSNEKRFNVAVTRAKALLIIVGNSEIICKNKHWKALCEYCKKHGGYVPFNKCPLNPDILKKYEIKSNDTKKVNTAVNQVSVTVETDVMGNEKKLETLTNVLVRSIEKKLTLTK